MNERDQAIERLFHQALERPSEARAQFVADAAPDAGVAAEVMALLGHTSRVGDDLPGRPDARDLVSAASELGLAAAPEVIGPYRIERTLGRGGFGIVYLAEQTEPVRRRIALKVIKRGMDTDDVVRRFEAERQALALLDHPAVAKLYDAGVTEDGRPYFAMEYVPGVTLTEYCDERRLGTEARLVLFVDVCAAVQHAHEKGILHRDLKPSNVLVRVRDGEATPVVIDFGLAKALHRPLIEGALVTREGVFVGTPEFASPEQLRSDGFDVDTRSDVYALGALLYHLLTGALPFEGEDAVQRGSRAGTRGDDPTPAAPSSRVASGASSAESAARRGTDARTLARRLRGDLDLITMKALEHDRARRYASVSELAADVRRHLADEPVLAAPPAFGYRARKFVRRHRAAVVSASMLGVCLVAGLVGTATGWRRAARQLELTRAAEARALDELRVSDAIHRHLTDVLGAANPWTGGGGREAKVADTLDLAARRAGTAFPGLPAVEGAVRRAIGENYAALGLLSEGEAQLRLALELLRGAYGEEHRWTVHTKASLATVLHTNAKLAESAALLRSVIAWRGVHTPADVEGLLSCERDLGSILAQDERFDESEALLRDVLARSTEALGASHRITRSTQFDLASLRYARGAPEEALALLEGAHRAGVAALGEDHAEVVEVSIALGGMLAVVHRDEEATAMLTRALAGSERAFGPQHPVTLNAVNNLGQHHQRCGDDAGAAPLLARAVEIGSAVRGARHPATLEARANLALLQRRTGDVDGAEANLRLCVEAAREQLGPESLEVATYSMYLAYVAYDRERFAEAEELFEEVIAVRSARLGPSHPETTAARQRLGMFLLGQGRLDEAEVVVARALADGRATLPRGDELVASVFELLIAVREDQGREAEAAALRAELAAWAAE